MIDIERQIDFLARHAPRYESAVRLQAEVWTGAKPERQPLLLTSDPGPQFCEDWPAFNYLEIHHSPDKMFSNGLREAALCARGGAEAVPSIRANMGCGIVPTMFGVRQQLFEDKMPWVKRTWARTGCGR